MTTETTTVTTTEKTVETTSAPAAELVLNGDTPSLTKAVKGDALMTLVAADVASYALTLPGCDPLIGRRCRALNRAHCALLAAFAPGLTDGDRERAELLADAYLEHHDALAGIKWYSLPGTQRQERLMTLQMFDRAISRVQHERMNQMLVGAIDNIADSLEKIRPSIEALATKKAKQPRS